MVALQYRVVVLQRGLKRLLITRIENSTNAIREIDLNVITLEILMRRETASLVVLLVTLRRVEQTVLNFFLKKIRDLL